MIRHYTAGSLIMDSFIYCKKVSCLVIAVSDIICNEFTPFDFFQNLKGSHHECLGEGNRTVFLVHLFCFALLYAVLFFFVLFCGIFRFQKPLISNREIGSGISAVQGNNADIQPCQCGTNNYLAYLNWFHRKTEAFKRPSVSML